MRDVLLYNQKEIMSKQRMLLIKNLKNLIKRIELNMTPLRIIEVWIFGSFLRMKKDPKDIDLILFYKKDPTLDDEVDKLQQLIISLNNTEEGIKILDMLYFNHDLATEFSKKTFPGLPVDIWLKHIKVKDTMSSYVSYSLNKSDITQKVLKSGMRYIQIAKIEDINDKEKIFSYMSAQVFKLMWSENNRDIDKNLIDLHSAQLNATLNEMKNFIIQNERYESYYYVLKKVIIKVIKDIQENNEIPVDNQVVEYAYKIGAEKGILDSYLNWIINQIKRSSYVEEPSLQEHVTNLDVEKLINSINNSVESPYELDKICESKRVEINKLRSKCSVARCLLSQILYPVEGYYIPSIEERVVHASLRAFSWIPMYKAKDEIKREVLIDLGLRDINKSIILVERLGTKSDYRLADSEEEIQELNDISNIGRIEKELAKYIRPIIKKAFPKKIDAYVHFNTIEDSD